MKFALVILGFDVDPNPFRSGGRNSHPYPAYNALRKTFV